MRLHIFSCTLLLIVGVALCQQSAPSSAHKPVRWLDASPLERMFGDPLHSKGTTPAWNPSAINLDAPFEFRSGGDGRRFRVDGILTLHRPGRSSAGAVADDLLKTFRRLLVDCGARDVTLSHDSIESRRNEFELNFEHELGDGWLSVAVHSASGDQQYTIDVRGIEFRDERVALK